MRNREMGDEDDDMPLFETKTAKRRVMYRLFAATVLLCMSLIWVYRLIYMPSNDENGRWAWLGLFAVELWFGLYWVFTQAFRWNQFYRFTFKDRLSHRYKEELPGVDVFVCTANPAVEPPIMVVNTVLSVMAYDYLPEKLSIYLSDDGGSDLTFYALLEASQFARHWIPYCKKFKVEPRSPAAYFASPIHSDHSYQTLAFTDIKKLYEEMEERIQTATKLGRVPEQIRFQHNGFTHWNSCSSRLDHDTILQIMIDGRDQNCPDIDGCGLPTLVYLAREKRPHHPHHFKAGALNALIRVSSKITNGPIILTLDCDMYSNNSLSVRDALCFFLDEQNSYDIAFVQFPQSFENIAKNDMYGNSLRIIFCVEFHGLDGWGGPLYAGTGCFHRRDVLCGRKFTEDLKFKWKRKDDCRQQMNIPELEEEIKLLASCTYEQNTPWGKEMGLIYGCSVEDVITGLWIQCRGWKSVYFNPERKAFLGVAPNTLNETLVQQKRWSDGDLQIFLSKYSPACFAIGKIHLGLLLGYCCYFFWAPTCLPTLYYTIIPSLYLVKGISLFPQVSSPWFLPFAYVISASYIYSLAEFLWCGGTIHEWWNDQRMWLYKRTSSYLFGFIDNILRILGYTESKFVITSKVSDEEVEQRYKQGIMEFGVSSPMFTILATLAILNLFCFVGFLKKVIMNESIVRVLVAMPLQILLCCVLVLINLPLYEALFLRQDKGKLPGSVSLKSFVLALFICTSFILLS